jgi:hypothetical protein
MTAMTLADLFGGEVLESSIRQGFNQADIEQAKELARAETTEETGALVNSMVARAADQMLDVSVLDILLGAWTRMRDLQEFAHGDKLLSSKTHKFVLAEYRVQSKHAPAIELFVREQKVAEVTIDVTLELLIAKTTLMIRQGRIMEARLSGCRAAGKLGLAGRTLLERQSSELALPSSLKFGDGIAIPPPYKRVQAGT